MTLTFEPLLPPVAWVSLAVLAIVMWVWYASGRPKACGRKLWALIMALTVAAIAAVLTVLLNPIWLETMPPPAGKPSLTILVDDSISMNTIDDGSKETRFVRATAAVQKLVKDVESTFDVSIRTYAKESQSTTVEQLSTVQPSSNVTNIATPLVEALAADRPQGQAVLLVSDGIHNATGNADRVIEAAEVAKSRDAPVYTATVGGDAEVSDLEIRVPRSQELAFAGQSIPVLIELQQHGQVGDRVDVILTDPDSAETTQTIRIEANSTATASFLVTPAGTGLFQYRVAAQGLPGEATTTNNSTSFQVRVVDKPVKALVLEGKPYWDGKFLLRTLTDDPSLEVDSLVRLSAERFLYRKLKLVDSVGDTTSAAVATNTETVANSSESDGADESTQRRFQRQEEMEFVENASEVLQDAAKLNEYQILLLGREAEFYLNDSAVENIRLWMAERGGALVCYRGSPVAEPTRKLSRLLPVKWATGKSASVNDDRFRIQVTERGDNLSWLQIGGRDGLAKLPSLAKSGATESIKPLAVVLGQGNADGASPVFTYQPYGMGKAVVVEGSGMWRWAFLSPEHQEMDAAYGTLWQSLLRWLISSGGLLPGEDMALQMDRVTFTVGEPISAVVLRRPELGAGDVPAVNLVQDGTVLRTIQPTPVGEELGVYQVFAGVLPEGHFQLELQKAEGNIGASNIHFDVQPDMREQLEVSARSDLMQRMAEVSGGEVLKLDDLSSLADRYNKHVEKSRPVQYRQVPAWDRWWVLIGVFALWSCSWTLRRRTGLV